MVCRGGPSIFNFLKDMSTFSTNWGRFGLFLGAAVLDFVSNLQFPNNKQRLEIGSGDPSEVVFLFLVDLLGGVTGGVTGCPSVNRGPFGSFWDTSQPV